MDDRTENFTRRAVGRREQLFTPESDPGANWDFFIFVIAAFGMAFGIGTIGIMVYLSYLLLAWP